MAIPPAITPVITRPSTMAPVNSKMMASTTACHILRVLAPTDVANALATSLAPEREGEGRVGGGGGYQKKGTATNSTRRPSCLLGRRRGKMGDHVQTPPPSLPLRRRGRYPELHSGWRNDRAGRGRALRLARTEIGAVLTASCRRRSASGNRVPPTAAPSFPPH